MMKVLDTSIPEVKVLQPKRFGDERGFFMETFRDQWFREHVADVGFVQDNHSKSKQGILRGLHYQLQQPQGKLVRVISGDRKSTRLNSSHVAISYAVFCLKKKIVSTGI